MAKKTEKRWESLLKQADEMVQRDAGFLFDRVSLLNQVFLDPEYREHVKGQNQSDTEELDRRVNFTRCNFPELRGMLEVFPERSMWAEGNLTLMRDKFLDSLRKPAAKKASAVEEQPIEANGHTTESETKVRKAEKADDVKSWKEETLKLREEVRMLKQANKLLRKQVRSLESLLKEQMQPA